MMQALCAWWGGGSTVPGAAASPAVGGAHCAPEGLARKLRSVLDDPDLLHATLTSLASPDAAVLGADVGLRQDLLTRACALDERASVELLLAAFAQVAGPGEVPALRAVAQAAWAAGRPNLAVVLTLQRERSVEAFCAKFPAARPAWVSLLEAGRLTLRTFCQQFAPTLAEVRAWRAGTLASPSEFAQALRAHPEVLAAALQAGLLEAELLYAMAPPGKRAAVGRALVAQHLGIAPVAGEHPRSVQAAAWQQFAAGQLPLDALLKTVPRPPVAKARALAEVRAFDPWHRLCLGIASAEEIEAAFVNRLRPVPELLQHVSLPDALAAALLRKHVIGQTAYLQSSAERWHPSEPLPREHVRFAISAPHSEALLASLPLPVGHRRRLTYAARMLAAHLVQAPLGVLEGPPGTACAVCDEAFSGASGAEPFRLSGCAHDAQRCAPCARQEIASGMRATCSVEGCRAPVTAEDALRAGASATVVTQRILATYWSGRPRWQSCTTPGCCGGQSFVATRPELHCAVCDQVSTPEAFDWKRDTPLLARLVAHLAEPSPQQLTLEAGSALTRECYHCGVPTQRSQNCSRLNCAHCKKAWDFDHGAVTHGYGGVAERPGPQRYVPRAGLLLRAGLYEGLVPGSTGLENIYAHARALAQQLGVPSYQRERAALPAPAAAP